MATFNGLQFASDPGSRATALTGIYQDLHCCPTSANMKRQIADGLLIRWMPQGIGNLRVIVVASLRHPDEPHGLAWAGAFLRRLIAALGESGMGQCIAQSSVRAISVDQTNAQPQSPKEREPLSQPTARGLELIKSCAGFYANGVGAATPIIQLSQLGDDAVNQPAPPLRTAKPNISTVALMCSFLLVLPSLALAAVIWWGTAHGLAKGQVVAVGDAIVSEQPPSPRKLLTATAQQNAPNGQSTIIVHKVRTERIEADALERPDHSADGATGSAEATPTDQ
jgi:hypothetical protein